jgi:hypothetical protein
MVAETASWRSDRSVANIGAEAMRSRWEAESLAPARGGTGPGVMTGTKTKARPTASAAAAIPSTANNAMMRRLSHASAAEGIRCTRSR